VLNRALLVSTGYRVLTREGAERAARDASGWHSARSAARQAKAYETLLANLRAGRPRVDLSVAAEAIAATGLTRPSVLEVGCGNGYYSEVLSRLVQGGLSYTGLDYSPAMVESAKERYPEQHFDVGDATALGFSDNAFDIVFNGVALMHILNFEGCIRESARVCRSHAIFHCVPTFVDHQTTYFSKFAYGEPVIEVVFNETDLRAMFAQSGLNVVRIWSSVNYDVFDVVGSHSRMITYLCTKSRV